MCSFLDFHYLLNQGFYQLTLSLQSMVEASRDLRVFLSSRISWQRYLMRTTKIVPLLDHASILSRGLIAILLRRVGLSCWKAIEVYKELGAMTSGGEADSRNIWKHIIEECQLSSVILERKLEDVTEKFTGRKGALLRPLKSAPDTVAHDCTLLTIGHHLQGSTTKLPLLQPSSRTR